MTTPVYHLMNSHENNTEEDFFVSLNAFPYLKAFCITSYSFTFVVGIVGNSVVIWIAGSKMKSVSAVWFLNLAIADFLCCLSLPVGIVEWAIFSKTYFPNQLCKVRAMSLKGNMYSSVYFMTIIGIDRCVSIRKPIWTKLHRTRRFAYTVATIVWVFCVILSVPLLVIYNMYCDFSDCTEKSVQNRDCSGNGLVNSLRGIIFAVTFLLPFIAILVSYGLMFLKLKNMRLKESHHSYKIFVAVVLFFFLCWFPYNIWPFVKIDKAKYQLDNLINEIFICLAYFNSCLNPIAYVFFCRDFKDNFIKSIPARLEMAFLDSSESQSIEEANG